MSNAARTIRSHQPQPDYSETHERGLSARSNVDAQELAEELRGRIRGEVRFDDGSRALYATDASNYRQFPIGVVIPRDKEDVIETIGVAHRVGAPVLARGGGTSLAGQCCNVAVVLDFSKHLNRVIEMDPNKNSPALNQAASSTHYVLKPRSIHSLLRPTTHNDCTLGGMIGNSATNGLKDQT